MAWHHPAAQHECCSAYGKGIDEYELPPVDVVNGAHIHLGSCLQWRTAALHSLFIFLITMASTKIIFFVSNQGPFASTWHASIGKEELICCGLLASKESAIIETHQFDGPIRSIIRQLISHPLRGLVPDEKIIEAEMEKLGKVLDVCEERLSKSKYLAGDDCTMADMQYIPYLVYFMRTPKAPRPCANAWWNDIASGMQLLKLQKA
ncbi:hypothetical protein AB3S75_046380 [Citrus x aurantiifolia]